MHKQHSISETPLYDSGKAFIANQVNILGFQTHLSLIKIKKRCDAHQDQLQNVWNITVLNMGRLYHSEKDQLSPVMNPHAGQADGPTKPRCSPS